MRAACIAALLCSACITDPARFHLGVDRSLAERARAVAPDAHLIVIAQRRSVQHRISSTRAYTTIEEYRATLINDQLGVALARTTVPYPESGSLVAIEAATILPDGRRIEVERSRMFDYEMRRSAGEVPLVERARAFAFPEACPGAIVEYRYVIGLRGLLLGDQEQLPDLPVLSAEYHADLATLYSYRTNQHGFVLREDHGVYSWTLGGPYLPTQEDAYEDVPGRTLPRLYWYVGKQTDWKDVSKAVWEDLDDDRDARLPELASTSTAVRDRVDAALRLTQDRVAVRDPLSHRDRKLEEVIASGYGTTMEAVRVLIALLRREELDPAIAFVPAPDMPDPVADEPSFEVVGGVPLVWVGDRDGWWLDVRCQNCGLGQFGPELQGRWALVLHPYRGDQTHVELVTVPWQWAPGGELEETLEIQASPESLRVQHANIRVRGLLAAEVRRAFLRDTIDDRDLGGRVRRFLGFARDRGTVKLDNLGDSNAVLGVEIDDGTLERASYVATADRIAFSLADAFRVDELEGFGPTRTMRVRFERRPDFVRTLVVRSPAGWSLRRVPEATLIDGTLGTYRLQVERQRDGVKLQESFTLKESEIDLEQYQKFREFLEKVLAARRAPVELGR